MVKAKPESQHEEQKIEHFKMLHQDIREEIKLRIHQRDTYSIQMTLALGTLVGIAATSVIQSTAVNNLAYRALIAAPLIAIYYTALILYSYRIHRLLSKYLREVIESELARLSFVSIGVEWENWYLKNAVPGIRRSFFLGSLWIITISSPLYVAFSELLQSHITWHELLFAPLGIVSIIYLVSTIFLTISFWKG